MDWISSFFKIVLGRSTDLRPLGRPIEHPGPGSWQFKIVLGRSTDLRPLGRPIEHPAHGHCNSRLSLAVPRTFGPWDGRSSTRPTVFSCRSHFVSYFVFRILSFVFLFRFPFSVFRFLHTLRPGILQRNRPVEDHPAGTGIRIHRKISFPEKLVTIVES